MMRLFRSAGIVTGALLAGSLAALAADSTSTATGTQPDASATTAVSVPTTGTARVEDRIASEFAVFAGSPDNARSLVRGLRQGSEVTLAASTGGAQTSTSTTFTPPTRPMGYGNVRISLALAQEQLIRLGVTQPTAEQLKASLVGGTVTSGSGTTATSTELRGVLQMRAEGMGWGQIANAMGTRLGHVMSGLRQTNQQLATGQPVPGAGTSVSAGTTTAAGASSGDGRGTQARPAREAGSGIVTAAGGSAAAGAGVQTGGGAHGAGLVTATGASAGSRASATGLLHGKGHAKP